MSNSTFRRAPVFVLLGSLLILSAWSRIGAASSTAAPAPREEVPRHEVPPTAKGPGSHTPGLKGHGRSHPEHPQGPSQEQPVLPQPISIEVEGEDPPPQAPEPSTLLLLGAGLIGWTFLESRRRRR